MKLKFFAVSIMICVLTTQLIGCQAVQERTNKEAPNQIKQTEGRQEIKKSGGEKNKKEPKESGATE